MFMDNSKNQFDNTLEQYKRQIQNLQAENEELAKKLYKVNEKLRDSERLKGHFISNITNEIVNPFTSILALAENIRELKDGEVVNAHRLADLIFEEAFHLDFQLKNIFAAALIESGNEELKLTPISIQEFGNQIAQYFQSQLRKKEISLLSKIDYANASIPAVDQLFVTDKVKLEMIAKNLVSNAIKFSPERSDIRLALLLEDKNLTIEVSDHGKGIREEDREVVFDRFKQLDEKINSLNTGHGLGLSIVQAYTELMGGKVSMSDNKDGGMQFKVTIPENSAAENWDDLEDFILDTEAHY
jgi:signal transduction histidine kinase